jgi:hypothetical protein
VHNGKVVSSLEDLLHYLKHKRQEISGVNLILFLDVEEKCQSKDTNEKKKARASLAPTWCSRTHRVETKENKTLSELLPLSRRT